MHRVYKVHDHGSFKNLKTFIYFWLFYSNLDGNRYAVYVLEDSIEKWELQHVPYRLGLLYCEILWHSANDCK